MAKIIPYLFLMLVFVTPVMGKPQTLVVDVRDLLMEVPQFNNSPDFNFWNSVNGGQPIGDSNPYGRRLTRAEREREMIDLMWSLYPSAQSITIWQGKLIIRFAPN